MTNENVKAKDKNLFKLGLAFFLLFAVDTALVYGLSFLFKTTFPSAQSHPLYVWLMSTLPLYAAGMPVCLAVLGKYKGEKNEPQKLGTKKFLAAFVATFGVTAVGNLAGSLLIYIVSFISGNDITNPLLDVVTQSNPFLLFIFVTVVAPFGEEFLFRRLIIDRTRIYGERFAILLSALMFSFFHQNIYQMLYAFLAGVVFGYVYAKTGKLRYSIALHSALNFVSGFLVALLTRKLLTMPLDVMLISQSDMIIYMLIAVIELLYLAFLFACAVTTIILAIVYMRRIKLAQGDVKGNLFSSPFLILFFVGCLVSTVITAISG